VLFLLSDRSLLVLRHRRRLLGLGSSIFCCDVVCGRCFVGRLRFSRLLDIVQSSVLGRRLSNVLLLLLLGRNHGRDLLLVRARLALLLRHLLVTRGVSARVLFLLSDRSLLVLRHRRRLLGLGSSIFCCDVVCGRCFVGRLRFSRLLDIVQSSVLGRRLSDVLLLLRCLVGLALFLCFRQRRHGLLLCL